MNNQPQPGRRLATGIRGPHKPFQRPKAKPKKEKHEYARLPAGSTVELRWDGQKWYGKLLVPGSPPFVKETNGGQRSCCTGLDRKYRAWLKAQEKTGG